MESITDYSFLPQGKQSAVPSDELATIMGFSSTRQLQIDIAKSRDAGQIICSSSTGGYFLPQTDEEIEEFVAVLRSRAVNTFRALRSAKQHLKQDKDQISLSNIEELI